MERYSEEFKRLVYYDYLLPKSPDFEVRQLKASIILKMPQKVTNFLGHFLFEI